MTAWVTPADTASDAELAPELGAVIEDVLQVADAWRAGELPIPEALALITAEPRAIGTAFRHAWRDPRRPALEALHMIEYGQREDEWGNTKVYTTFGWMSTGTFEQVERHMSGPDMDTLRYRRKTQ